MDRAKFTLIAAIPLVGIPLLVKSSGGCSVPEADTRAVLQHASIQERVSIDPDYPWFSCGKEDSLATRFAVHKDSGPEYGVVCCGLLLKDCTIRWER